MEKPAFRKPRHYFDTTSRPSHVTFDDGKSLKRNLPWAHFVEARWDYGEPDAIKVTIGNWLVVIMGHNLDPLYVAIEEHTLARVKAHPAFADDAERIDDSFATEIRFVKGSGATKRKGQGELVLGLE